MVMVTRPFGKLDNFPTLSVGETLVKGFAEEFREELGKTIVSASALVFLEERIVIFLAVFGENRDWRIAKLTKLEVRQDAAGAAVAIVERVDIFKTSVELGDFVEEISFGSVVAMENIINHDWDMLWSGGDMPADADVLANVPETASNVIIYAGDEHLMKLEDVRFSQGIIGVLLEEGENVGEILRLIDFADICAVRSLVAKDNCLSLGEAKSGVLDSVRVVDHFGDLTLGQKVKQRAAVRRDSVVISLQLRNAVLGRGVDHGFIVAKMKRFVKSLREYCVFLGYINGRFT